MTSLVSVTSPDREPPLRLPEIPLSRQFDNNTDKRQTIDELWLTGKVMAEHSKKRLCVG
jgi:hypothetical protein